MSAEHLDRLRIGRVGATPAAALLCVVLAACSASTPSPSSADLPSERGPSAAASSAAAPPTPSPRPTSTPTADPGSVELAVSALPRLDQALRSVAISAFSGDPRGVVIVGKDRRSGALLALTSADGSSWVQHWLDGRSFGGGTPTQLVASPMGYLAVGWSPSAGSGARVLWSSPDGVAWSETPTDGLPAGDIASVAGTPFGAVVEVDGPGGQVVATRSDGTAWQSAVWTGARPANIFALVPLPDGAMVLGTTLADQAAGRDGVRAWRSSDGRIWSEAAELGTAISSLENGVDQWLVGPWGTTGASVGPQVGLVSGDSYRALAAPPATDGRLVAGPAGLVWFAGSDGGATCAAAWRFDGTGWRPLIGTHDDQDCRDRASAYVIGAAPTRRGLVVLATLGVTHERAAWLLGPPGPAPIDAVLSESGEPPSGSIPDPLAAAIERPATCPAVPGTFAAFAVIPPITAVGCFGDRALSFRAWIVDPGEGYGGTCAPFTPSWILECVLPSYLLSENRAAVDSASPIVHAMRAPGATGTTKGVGRWVRITGHFDDAISPTCRGVGDSTDLDLVSEIPPAVAVLSCRLVFVVSDVRDAP